MTAMAQACWFCDGRLREHEGVPIGSLGGVIVHGRCMSELGITDAPRSAESECPEDIVPGNPLPPSH